MAPNPTNGIQKHKMWMAEQIRHLASLKTPAGRERFQKTILEILEDNKDTKPQSVRQYLTIF
jgi:hypothetical protein